MAAGGISPVKGISAVGSFNPASPGAIGGTTPAAGTFTGLTVTQGTLAANATGVSITATWNNAAVTFDAPLFMNITNTASAAGSLLQDLQVAGVSQFAVAPSGNFGNFSTSSVPLIDFGVFNAGVIKQGVRADAGGNTTLYSGGSAVASAVLGSGLQGPASGVGFAVSSNPLGTIDTRISRLGAASLAVGNGTAGDFSGALKLTTLNIASGGSTTISTGVGSVKMSTANAATNAVWIPLQYAGTTYFVAGFTTNAP